ncbi:MAG TPA: pyruvate, water dikinase regulatory protein [Bacillota bacterium]|nr:pyruvate, water dikinase regulatory protein [Bacillota bacterium]
MEPVRGADQPGPGPIFIVSDSIGETAELVARAAASQFDSGRFEVHRFPFVNDAQSVKAIIEQAVASRGAIVYTLVQPQLSTMISDASRAHGIPVVDIMGPVIEAIGRISEVPPRLEPGLSRRLDEEYFRRVEAVEFAVKHDDGKDPRGLLAADCVLLGVSRVSKTPVSMYLAHRKIKAANLPLVPELELPAELAAVPAFRLVGLTAEPQYILEIRRHRLKVIGLKPGSEYAELDRIVRELDYASSVFRSLGSHVIDITRMAVEETASRILELLRQEEASR